MLKNSAALLEGQVQMMAFSAKRNVDAWLRERSGRCFCDECIAQDIGLERKTIGRLVTTGQFSRYRGRCMTCGNVRTVAVSQRLVWA